MALSTCNECGHQVSDKPGSICPGCGAPSSPDLSGIKSYQVVALIIAALGAVTFFLAPPPFGPFVGGMVMIVGMIGALDRRNS